MSNLQKGTKPPLAGEVSLQELASRSELENWTGADLAALMREAAMQAMRDATSGSKTKAAEEIFVKNAHIEHALGIVRPSVSETVSCVCFIIFVNNVCFQDLKRYEELRVRFSVSHL